MVDKTVRNREAFWSAATESAESPLWILRMAYVENGHYHSQEQCKAPSSLRFAGALQKRARDPDSIAGRIPAGARQAQNSAGSDRQMTSIEWLVSQMSIC